MISCGVPPEGMENTGFNGPVSSLTTNSAFGRSEPPCPRTPSALAGLEAAPGRGGGVSSLPPGGSSLHHFHGEQPAGSLLPWEQCHVPALLDFGSSVRTCLPHAPIGARAQSLLKAGDAWQFVSSPLFTAIGPSNTSCGRRGR